MKLGYQGNFMKRFYFDLSDGVPVRDNGGIELDTLLDAKKHSRKFADLLRRDGRLRDPNLAVIVLDASGSEVHREPVFPMDTRLTE
jgi:Mg-chelatase subunit ChlD